MGECVWVMAKVAPAAHAALGCKSPFGRGGGGEDGGMAANGHSQGVSMLCARCVRAVCLFEHTITMH